MPEWTMVEAINDALRLEMRRQSELVLLGEDIGKLGGVFRCTAGLQEEFGEARVVDMPLNEGGIVGAALGMAMVGVRTAAEIQFADYLYPAFDQLISEVAKARYRSGGQFSAPLTIRAPYGGGIRGGHYHSQSPEAYLVHTAGLKVVIPSTPADAKGLLTAALRDPDPVVFLEPKRLYRAPRGETPEGEHLVPFEQAAVRRAGEDVSLFAYGAMVPLCLEAAERLAGGGVAAEVVDLRTLWPVDIEAVVGSVRKTGRAVIVHEAPRTCGYGAEISALLAERCIDSLLAPVLRVTGLDTPFPFALEDDYLPSVNRLLRAVQATLKY